MAECRECDRSIPDASNFCPQCGAPQNEEAAKALESFTKRRISELSPQELEALMEKESAGPIDRQLLNRVSYVLGWVAIVLGLAVLPSLAGVLFLVAGIAVLPPVRRLVGNTIGQTPGIRPTLVAYAAVVLLAAVVHWVV